MKKYSWNFGGGAYPQLRDEAPKLLGFTLAEVLITLGIIGVVAALTIPSLIAHHKKLETATRVKKFYSILSQAIKMSEIDNGPSAQWNKEEMALDEEGNLMPGANAQLALTYFNRYLKDYIKYIKVDDNPEEKREVDQPASLIKIYLSDGSTFYLNNGTCAHFQFDTNGDRKPNANGRDIFHFLLCPPDADLYIEDNGPNLIPYVVLSERQTREKALQICKIRPQDCSGILMMDGWEFKDDYPHKL